MLSDSPALLQRLLGRVPKAAAFGARLYLAIIVIQFVCGFVVGAGLVMFDYNLDFFYSLLPADN